MKSIHVYFGTKDGDLIYWKHSIPKNSFSFFVRAALAAERKKKIAYIPVPASRGSIDKPFDVKVFLTDKDAALMMESIPKFKRKAELKRILRKHLEANYSGYFVKKQPDFVEVEQEPVINKEVVSLEESNKATVDEDEYIVETDRAEEAKPEINDTEDDEMSEEYKKMLRQMSGQ